MTHRRFFLSALFASSVVLFCTVRAQLAPAVSVATVDSSSADQAWEQAKQSFSAPVTTSVASTASNASTGGGQALGQADAAKQFYTKFPGNVHVTEARKMEILALLSATIPADPKTGQRLVKTVSDFVVDSGIVESERSIVAGFYAFHVALQQVKKPGDELVLFEQVARNLIKQYPQQPQGYESLLAVAAHSPDQKGRQLATELAGLGGPSEVKKGTQRLLTRLALPGQKLSAALTTQGLKSGQPVIVYTWATWSPDSLTLAHQLGQRQAGAANWIGLNLDSAATHAAATQAVLDGGFPGTQIYDVFGVDGVVATKLGLDSAPTVYLIDASGVIQDIHGLDDLVKKLSTRGL